MNDSINHPPASRRYAWPWIVAAFVSLGIVLCVLAIRNEARRVREQQQFKMPSSVQ